MRPLQLAALAVLAAFYAVYFAKLFLQRRQGIQTDQLGKGDKPKHLLRIERLTRLSTYFIVPMELICIRDLPPEPSPLRWAGIALAAAGVAVFAAAVVTMRDSWRAGIPAEDRTALVTHGIYRLSRNPAFLGFDLMYLGLLLAFFHPAHLLAVVFAAVMFHLQILQEERFLAAAFGEEYARYQKRAGRYLFF